MANESPIKAVLVVILVALITSSLVSATVVVLRPIKLNNELLDRGRNIMHLTGLLPDGVDPSDKEMLSLFKRIDTRIVDIDAARFDTSIESNSFDKRRAATDPGTHVAIPTGLDRAGLGRRSRFATAYLVWQDDKLARIILPINGIGMWSELYAYIALEPDLNTIADVSFYQQNETPGLGDQITRPNWLAHWRGRRLYDEQGELRFAVAATRVDPESLSAAYEVDALTGATVTADAVTGLVHYWFGAHGYRPFLEHLHAQIPSRPKPAEDS